MKKRIAGLLLFLLCLLAFQAVALADDVKLSVTAEPAELSEAGVVNFAFEISNNSIYELHNVTIAYMGETVDIMEKFGIPPVAIGGSVSGISLPFNVSDAQLDQPLRFTVAWLQGGEPFSQELQCVVARAANPVISVTRTASAEMARQGETITLTYELKNETRFDMTDIVLIDENLSDNPIMRLDTLKANGTSTMTHQYKMGTEDVISAPIVNYVVNGKTKVFSSITPLTLSMMLIKLDMRVDAGVPTQAGVTFTLEIKNSGNQAVRDIQITDERGNPVNGSAFSLNPGDTVTYPYLVVPVMTEPIRNVAFKLSGTDVFDQPYTLSPATSYEVYPFVDESQINVILRAETVTPWSSETGTVTARVILTNHSTVTLTNVVVSEATIGVVKTLDTLPAGETFFDQELLIGSPRNLQFSVKGNDPTGTVRELSNCLLPVAYSAATPGPAATTAPSESRNPARAFSFLSTTISKILVVLGVLMVMAFITLIVLSVMDRGRSDRLRFDEEDEDDELDGFFDVESPVEQDLSPESEKEYFTRRIARAAETAGTAPQASPPSQPISLPPAQIQVEYDDDARSEATAILSEIEAHTADILSESARVEAAPKPVPLPEPEPEPLPEADDPLPGPLPTPKVIALRKQPAVQPLIHGQIRHVRHDDEER